MRNLSIAFTLVGISFMWGGLVFGWGLTPASWPWIIGCTCGSFLAYGFAQLCMEKAKEPKS